MITSIQIILIFFIFFAASRAFLRFREKAISSKVFIFWTVVWLVALLAVISPPITSRIAAIFGVGRGVDVIVYLSLVLLFYLVFRLYVMIEDLRHEITYIVRQVALRRVPRKRSKKISK